MGCAVVSPDHMQEDIAGVVISDLVAVVMMHRELRLNSWLACECLCSISSFVP